ncbi:hypothetical protein AX16_001332 [Volvariella volvacea WC 439]|nr:hypothetical protein AX16_001332 [Volvariella volvacea WC 439]
MSELEDNSQGSLSDIPTRHDGVSQHLALLEDKECQTEKTPVLLSQLLDIVHTDRTQCQKARQTTLSYNSEFAPVNRLPIEVLQDIFMHCCPPVKERGDVLWDLERVSRKWRQTALGCTVLLSFITVSSDVLKWYRVHDPHHMLEIWLERSRKRPLNITFGAFNGDQDPPPSLFPLLLLHIQRWRTLMLGIYFDVGIIGSLKSAQGKLPLLHSLSLFIRTKRDNPVTTAICLDAFSDAPNLHHMSLSLHECYRINNPSNSLMSLAVLNPDFLKNLTFPNLKVLCVTDYCQSDGGLDMFSAILQFIQRSCQRRGRLAPEIIHRE